MAIRCPNCKGLFNDDRSYQNHLPCTRSFGGEADLRETHQEFAKEGGTGGGRP